MKLSYILSIIIGISAFCILYLGLDFGVIFSLIVSVIAYFASTMVFKEKDEFQIEVNGDLVEYERLGAEAVQVIRKIELVKDKIDNKELVEDITKICETSNKIAKSLKDNPKKTKQVRKFINYYLPFTLNILTQYNTIEDQALTSKESKDFMAKVETTIKRVKDACEEQLNHMYETDLVNTNADIKVFETMLKTDGLVDDNMNIVINDRK